jgi:hypothetical protein
MPINMRDEQYRKLTPGQKRAYWVIVVAAVSFIAYMFFFYR